MLEKAMTLLGASVVPVAGLMGEPFPVEKFGLFTCSPAARAARKMSLKHFS
jgi:hypothetical protein